MGKRNNYSFAESLALYGFTESKKGSSIYPCVIPANPLRRLLDRLIASIVHIVVNELTIKGCSRHPEKSQVLMMITDVGKSSGKEREEWSTVSAVVVVMYNKKTGQGR